MKIQFQDWVVDTTLNQLQRGEERVRLEPLAMNVLACLLEHADQVVSIDSLLDRYWSGRNAEPGMVARCIAQIRLALGDDARKPRYVETVRKRGYRAIDPIGDPSGPMARALPASTDQVPLKGIAVMPFDDLSPDADHAWLADGIVEELIEFLGRVPGLRVPPRTSAAVLKGQQADAETVRERLDVDTLVSGSVSCIGDRLRVVVRWTRIEDHARLWSAHFERKREGLLELQKEIAVGISEAIRKELGIHDAAEFVSRDRYQTFNVRAWEAFRRGFSLVFTFKPSKMAEGREYLRHSLEIDPDYLEARAWLAWSDFDRPDRKNEGSLRVLEKQPSNPVALCSLITDSETQWDFETAERLWRYAVAHNPANNQLTLVGFHLTSCLGLLEESLEVARRGIRIDPLWPTHHFFLGLAHLNLGDPAAAIDPIRKAISLGAEIGDPAAAIDLSWAYQYLAIACQFVGNEAEAIDALQKGFRRYREEIAEGARTAGWRGANLALIRASPDFPESHPYRLARVRFKAAVYASVGERELMYRQLSELMAASAEFAVRNREAVRTVQWLTEFLRAYAEFHPYWEEPEFKSLKQQLEDRIARSAGKSGYADVIR